MKIRNAFFLIAALVAGNFLTGCTEEDGVVPGGDGDYGKPSGLEVTSISATQIKARWTRASDDVGVDTLIAVPVGGGVEMKATTTASSTDNTATVGGLVTGVSYNLYVAAQGTAGRTGPVVWMTAVRFGSEATPLRIWETADNTPGHFSGLILSTGVPTSILAANKNDIDVVLAIDNSLPAPGLALQGADVQGSGGLNRKTRFGNNYYIVAAGLNGDYYTTSFASEIKNSSDPSAVNFVPIPPAASDPIIILTRTADNNYARIEVVKQSNGLLWGEDATAAKNRFIDVVVSYQTTNNVGMAGRPGVVERGFNTPKAGGSTARVKN
jgi:hypothetical protein